MLCTEVVAVPADKQGRLNVDAVLGMKEPTVSAKPWAL